MAEMATSEARFFADGADLHDRERPGLIAGFGRGGGGTTAQQAAARLNACEVEPGYYEWWVPAA
jgi:hypothetical protein